MKRILALLLFALATATISFAQSNFQDVIYLKDGSVVRGTIIDKVPNKSVQIKMADKTGRQNWQTKLFLSIKWTKSISWQESRIGSKAIGRSVKGGCSLATKGL